MTHAAHVPRGCWTSSLQRAAVVASVVILGLVGHALGESSLLNNATCSFTPSVATGLRASTLSLVTLSVTRCSSRVNVGDVTTLTLTVNDVNLGAYLVGSTVTINVAQYFAPSLLEADLALVGTKQFFVVVSPPATTAAPKAAVATTSTTAPFANQTTARLTTATSAPTTAAPISPVTPSPAVVTSGNFLSIGTTGTFTNVATFSQAGLWRTAYSARGTILALPDAAPVSLAVASPVTCDAVTGTVSGLAALPSNGSVLSGPSASILVYPADSQLESLISRNVSCTFTVTSTTPGFGSKLLQLTAGAAAGYSLAAVIVMALVPGWITVDVGGLCNVKDAGAASLLAQTTVFAVPATRLYYYVRPAAPAPSISLSPAGEAREASLSTDWYNFGPVTVSFTTALVGNSTTFVLVIPGSVPPAGLPPIRVFTAYSSVSSPFPTGGISVTQTSWVFAMSTAPDYTLGAVTSTLIQIQQGTEQWKYSLLAVVVCILWCAYVAFVIRDAVRMRLTVIRRREARKEAAALVPLQAVIFGSGDEYRVAESTQEPTDRKERKRWKKRCKALHKAQREAEAANDDDDRAVADSVKSTILRRVCFFAFVFSDLTVAVLNITFAATCLAYGSVGAGYKVCWTITEIVLIVMLLLRWYWSAQRFDPPTDDDAMQDEEEEVPLSERIETSLSLQFAPLINVGLSIFFAKRMHTLRNTERSRAFWSGVVRLTVDLPQLVIVGIFIGHKPTYTNDASLLQFFFSLACVMFGLEGMLNAAVVSLQQLIVACRDEPPPVTSQNRKHDSDDHDEDEHGDGSSDDVDNQDGNAVLAADPLSLGPVPLPSATSDPFAPAVSTSGAPVVTSAPFQLPTAAAASTELLTAEEAEAVMNDIETIERLRQLRELGYSDSAATAAPPSLKSVKFLPTADPAVAAGRQHFDKSRPSSDWATEAPWPPVEPSPPRAADDEATEMTIDFYHRDGGGRDSRGSEYAAAAAAAFAAGAVHNADAERIDREMATASVDYGDI